MAKGKRSRSDEPAAYRPPTAAQMIREQAESMARQAVLNSPAVKKAIAAQTKAIVKATQHAPKTRLREVKS